MAAIHKNTALMAPANFSGPKRGASTRFSSVAETSVELMEGSAGVSFDSSAFRFSENTDTGFNHENSNKQSVPQHGFVDSPIQAFESMLQGMDTPRALSDNSHSSYVFSVPYVGLFSKAIEIYETNTRIFNGEIAIRGTSFSVVL